MLEPLRYSDYQSASALGYTSRDLTSLSVEGGLQSGVLQELSDPIGQSISASSSISSNSSTRGFLDSTDPINPTRPSTYSEDYLLTDIVPGQQVQVNLSSFAFDTYLQVINADTDEVVNFDDDSGSGLNSQLTFTVEEGIDYIVRSTSYGSGDTGSYTLTIVTSDLGVSSTGENEVAIGVNSDDASASFNRIYGYGLVDAAAAVTSALGESSPFPDIPNLGGDSWGLDAINAPEVWAQGYTGEGIVVAVVDNGVDYTHPDLDANIWVNSDEVAGNGIDDDGNGYVDDIRGWDFAEGDNDPMPVTSHGTHVAGIIAAENNDIGITGVAYNADIMPVRVFDNNDNGTSDNLADGIRYAADNGADIINLSLSLGPNGYSREVEAAVEYATDLGAVVVMAAGNQSASYPAFPASLSTDIGIAVGAVDSTNTLADASNRAGITPRDYVVAPGIEILSTTVDDTYGYLSGTSMATPHVAGVAALVLSANPELTPDAVESFIIETANPEGITV